MGIPEFCDHSGIYLCCISRLLHAMGSGQWAIIQINSIQQRHLECMASRHSPSESASAILAR